jgi:SagB-type dehydrogenase family enzyme
LRLWSLGEDVLVEVAPGGDHLVALTQWGEIRIDDASDVIRESLARMSLGPVSVENLPVLRDSFLRWRGGNQVQPTEPWVRFRRVLETLGNSVVQSLGFEHESGPALSVVPVSRQARFWLPKEIGPRPVRLSRFTSLRVDRGVRVLESPLAHHRVLLHRPLAGWVVGSLAGSVTIPELAELLGQPQPVVAEIVAYLVSSGMMLVGESDGPDGAARFAEDTDPDLAPWSHHDLTFHGRTRTGPQHGPGGGSFPAVDRRPDGRRTPRPAGPRFPLRAPEFAELIAADPTVTEAIEVSGSPGDYSAEPVSAEQLGELLFRVSRVRWAGTTPVPDLPPVSPADRPPQAAGGLHELDLYLTLDRCTGLPRGSYHYDPDEHALTLVNDSESELAELLDLAGVAAGSTRRPPVLITVTTKLAKLSWMLDGLSYATTVWHVGALQQTVHMVATAMGLASRALAVSDGAIADVALRLRYPVEVSVGELLVGIRT